MLSGIGLREEIEPFGIEVREERRTASRDFTNLIRVGVVTDGEELRVAGTTIGTAAMRGQKRSGRLLCRPCLDWSERRYHIAHAINRKLWLVRLRLEPDYAGRPWILWTANDHLMTEADDKPLRWVVVQR